jgi:hypothetical protein
MIFNDFWKDICEASPSNNEEEDQLEAQLLEA